MKVKLVLIETKTVLYFIMLYNLDEVIKKLLQYHWTLFKESTHIFFIQFVICI